MTKLIVLASLFALAACAQGPGAGPASGAAQQSPGSTAPAPVEVPHTNPKMDGPPSY